MEREESPEGDLLEQPPPESNYRDAEDPAKSCATCAHYENEDGVCVLYKAYAEPEYVCDQFKKDPKKTEMEGGKLSKVATDVPSKTGGDTYMLSELHLSGGRVVADEAETDLIWKEVLHEGRWAKSPDAFQNPVDVPMHIVPEGTAVGDALIRIGLKDVYDAFEEGAIEHVTIPGASHNDTLLDNFGYVRKLKLDKRDDGKLSLLAGLEFKDDAVKDKAQKGLIPDTSCGFAFNYTEKKDGKRYPVALEHVMLTKRPWVGGNKPFGLSEDGGDQEHVFVSLMEGEADETSEEKPEPKPKRKYLSELSLEERLVHDQRARSHEIRRGGEVEMGETSLLEGLDLSEDVKSTLETALMERDEKVERLQSKVRERAVEDRIDELKKIGFAEHPGFLKEVRALLLADTEGVSLVLSEEKDGKVEKVGLSVTDVVDRLLGALPREDGRVRLSEQHVEIESGDKPAPGNEEEEDDETRLRKAAEFLGMSEGDIQKQLKLNEKKGGE